MALSDLDTMIAYSENATASDHFIRYVTYAFDDWQPESTAVGVNDDGFRWPIARTSPDGSEQVVVAVNADNTDKPLYVTIFDGTNWDDGNGSPYGDAKDLGLVANSVYRNFGAA